MLVPAESLQVDKHRIALHLSRILNTQMVRVCEHAHDFLLHILLCVG